jgi:hypothetical protein
VVDVPVVIVVEVVVAVALVPMPMGCAERNLPRLLTALRALSPLIMP